MSDRPLDRPRDTPEDRTLERLLRLAGERERAPDLVRERVRRRTQAAWRARVEEHRRQSPRRTWVLPLAAVLGGVALLGLWWTLWLTGPEPTVWLASLESAGGMEVGATDRWLANGAEWRTGPDERLALRLATDQDRQRRADGEGSGEGVTATGAVVRLAGDSHLRLTGPGELTLERGQLYVDTQYGAPTHPRIAGHHDPVKVHTPLGVVQDVGTEFTVTTSQDTLRVRVREGRVEVTSGGREHAAAAGHSLTVDHQGRVSRQPVTAHGPAWEWVVEAAPKLNPAGRTVAEVLTWVAEETGWRVQWEDPDLEREAAGLRVRGNPGELAPDQAAAVVLPGADLAFGLEDGVLTVTR